MAVTSFRQVQLKHMKNINFNTLEKKAKLSKHSHTLEKKAKLILMGEWTGGWGCCWGVFSLGSISGFVHRQLLNKL